MAVRASIVGGSGYAGGELLRLLLGHPHIEVVQVTSQRFAGRFVHGLHPNLRGATRLKFSSLEDLKSCDLLFLALPHGHAMDRIEAFASLAERIVDLSADFRLRTAADYEKWYGGAHPAPEWLERFGRVNAAAFDARGWIYYSGENFDLYYPGYSDSYSSLRGAVGMTYEVGGGGRAGSDMELADGRMIGPTPAHDTGKQDKGTR